MIIMVESKHQKEFVQQLKKMMTVMDELSGKENKPITLDILIDTVSKRELMTKAEAGLVIRKILLELKK